MKNNDLELLLAGTEQVIPREELANKLQSGKKLKIKLGMDPTSPDLHLGHAVVLSKLKQFQDLGHEVIFLIGDFTARIGDPTGKSKTRPPLSEEEIKSHTQTYFEQVSKILDPQKITIAYNAQWLDQLSMKEWIKLCAKVTLARIIEREDFAKRLEQQQPIGFHELFYPILQGYDSIELHADVELGGTDQTFNLLMGRFLQEQYQQEPQVIITMPLLVGIDGHEKMSKSLGNAIGLAEPADQAYGKIMSLSDVTMWSYYQLLLHTSDTDIARMQKEIADQKVHPMEIKKQLAYRIIEKFWSKQEAKQAQQTFEHLFQKRDLSFAQEYIFPQETQNPLMLVELIKLLGGAESSSQARRLIEAGAVSIDDAKITNIKAQITVTSGMCIKIGKHTFYKLVVK
ncbi:MAG: tyrosine--tRNA ligase [Candidatus Babeliaceae bacterium]